MSLKTSFVVAISMKFNYESCHTRPGKEKATADQGKVIPEIPKRDIDDVLGKQSGLQGSSHSIK